MSSGAHSFASPRMAARAKAAPALPTLSELASVTVQLGLLLWIVHLFSIEELYGFDRLTVLILGGFVVHAVLPLPFRPPFFLALSIGAIVILLGFPGGLYLLVLALALIGACHLPVPFWARVGLVVALSTYLALARAVPDLPGAWPLRNVIPVLAAMFMFRLVLYLYEMRHERTPLSWPRRLSYFFLLPNACFPLFPVVDYQRYKSTYYDAPAGDIYRKGVRWIFRGIVQLLLYRVVYHWMVLPASDVDDLPALVLYVVSSYLLYLRISGSFHLIVGILCLFGHNLPPTHREYFLASSVNDFWRRINIYWKDFVMKILYYPIYMRLRGLGLNRAMALATLATLVLSWLLHSYQWFWLRGTFPLTVQDAVFWSLLGVLVAVNSVYEATHAARRVPGTRAPTIGAALRRSAQTVGMFVFMCLLWSFWTSRSVAEWTSVMSVAARSSLADLLGLGLALLALVLVGTGVQVARARGLLSLPDETATRETGRAVAWRAAAIAFLLALGSPYVQGLLGAGPAGVVETITSDRLNRRDGELLTRGYYEELLGVESYTSALWSVRNQAPEEWDALRDSDAARPTDDFLLYELVPSSESTFKEATLRTNRWGMRDREYAMEKPRGTYRIAFMGASYGMGSGVENDQIFEAIAESRLAQERTPDAPLEILNFSVGGYSVLHSVYLLEHRIPAFEPDAIVQIGFANDAGLVEMHLRRLVREGAPIPYPEVEEALQKAGVAPGMDDAEIEARLRPVLDEITAWAYARIVELSRARGSVPVWVFLPRTDEHPGASDARKVEELARAAGFLVLSLENAYEDRERRTLYLAPWDTHPNARGHELLADEFLELLGRNANALGLTRTTDASLP